MFMDDREAIAALQRDLLRYLRSGADSTTIREALTATQTGTIAQWAETLDPVAISVAHRIVARWTQDASQPTDAEK